MRLITPFPHLDTNRFTRKIPRMDPYQQVIDTLSPCKRVLITTHVRPDGDALGSAAALTLALKAKGIDAMVLLLSHLPRKYAFVFQENDIPFADAETAWPPDLSLDDFDAFVAVDTGTWSQLPGLEQKVLNYKKPRLVIDHHLTQENWADIKLVDTQAAAAGEIIAQLLERWRVPIDQKLANALFVAIATDTGWFQFSNTRPQTMRLAATLMEAGVDTDRLYQLLYQNERKERVSLQARALNSMELLSDDRLAVMRISKKDFEQTGANVPDTENLINLPLQIATVEVSLLLVEPRDFGPVRISLRSKGHLDVAQFAQKFGGGGHARASGLKLEGDFQQAHDQVVAAMLQAMSSRPK
jgi:nanoRNase/pAp phosphatase (c-di-AMP/oligoRNAs hydrolase)